MDKQNAILKSHEVEQAQEFEVIGQGGMVDKPCQIGEWWVMPADQYTGTIPANIQEKWDSFKALNIPVLGYLVADDIRTVRLAQERQAKEEQERLAIKRAEQEALWQHRLEVAGEVALVIAKVLFTIAKVTAIVIAGAVAIIFGIIGFLFQFDPVLIAVLPDGRWVCLGAWWD